MSAVDEFLKTAMSPEADKPAKPNEGIDALSKYMAHTGDAKAYDKELFEQLFANGTSGKYQTRTKTLIEKTAEVLKK